jgi:hypothetical protein
MPKRLLTLLIIPRKQLQACIRGNGTRSFHYLTIHFGGYYISCKAFTNALGNFMRVNP